MNRYISIPFNYIKTLISKMFCLMRHTFRYILIPGIIITAVITAVFAFMIWQINPEEYRGILENSLSKTLNAQVKILGEMKVDINPFEQSVLANQIVAKNLVTDETFLEARKLFVQVNLLNLLHNQIKIDKLKVVDGTLKVNKVASEEKDKQREAALTASPQLQIRSLSFQNFSIENTDTKVIRHIPVFTLTIKNNKNGSHINAELLYNNENAVFDLKLLKPFTLDVLNNPVDFLLTIDVREIGTFRAEGSCNYTANSVVGNVDWKLDNPARLFKLLDAKSIHLSPLHLKADVDLKKTGISFNSIRVQAAGSNQFNGKLAIDWSELKPRLDGILTVPFFNIDEVFLDSSEILKEKNMDYKLVEFNILNKFNSHLDVSIQYFKPQHGITLRDFHADTWLVNGLFSAVNIAGKIGGGTASGDIYVDARIPRQTHILADLSLMDSSVEQTILDFTNQEPASIKGGTYTAKIVIDTRGYTPRELLAWDVNFEANLHKSVLAKDSLQSIIGRDSFMAWKAKVNDINFTCAVIRAKIDNGLLETQNETIVLESDAVNIIGFASLNIPRWTMEASVAMQPQKGFSYNISGTALNFAKVTGRINNPKINFSLFSASQDKKSFSGIGIIDTPFNFVKNIAGTTVESIPFMSQLTRIFKDPHPCQTALSKELPAGFNKDLLDLSNDESLLMMHLRIKAKNTELIKKLGIKQF